MIPVAARLALAAIAMTIGIAQTPPPTQHVLGGVTVVVPTRMLNLPAFRKFDSVADRTELEAFNKAWVRRIIAANP